MGKPQNGAYVFLGHFKTGQNKKHISKWALNLGSRYGSWSCSVHILVKNDFPPISPSLFLPHLTFFLNSNSPHPLDLGHTSSIKRAAQRRSSFPLSPQSTSHSLFTFIYTLFKRFLFVTLDQWTNKSSFQIAIATPRYAVTLFFGFFSNSEDVL